MKKRLEPKMYFCKNNEQYYSDDAWDELDDFLSEVRCFIDRLPYTSMSEKLQLKILSIYLEQTKNFEDCDRIDELTATLSKHIDELNPENVDMESI